MNSALQPRALSIARRIASFACLGVLAASSWWIPRGECAAAAEPSEGLPVSIRYSNSLIESITILEWNGIPYVSVNDVSRLFGASKEWRPEIATMELRWPGTRLHLALGNPFATLDEQSIVLPGPVEVRESVLWAPLALVTEHLAPGSSDRVRWSATRRELWLGGPRPNITRVVTVSRGDDCIVEIETTSPLGSEVARESARSVVVSIRGGVLPLDSLRIDDGAHIIDSIDQGPAGDRALIRMRLSRDVASAVSVGAPAEPRSTILLTREEIDEDDFLRGRAAGGRDVASRWERRRGGVRTVVIDAGHGGADKGSVGKNALAEKDVTLAVALALRSRIADRLGLSVVLTRETDENVPTERRAQIANEAEGDLFISLHCNAWSDAEAGGFESYFLSAASTNEERATEAMENRSAGEYSDGIGEDVRFILWDLAQAEYLDESSQLAELIGNEMDRALTLRNRGVKQGEFVVLYGAFMPAVLIEMGFISNEGEAQMLASGEFQSHVADAIASGIETFVAKRALSDGAPQPSETKGAPALVGAADTPGSANGSAAKETF